jgi:hypothetical protein
MTSGEARMTYRERRERRANRLREWADKRNVRAEAATEQARQLADLIPFGQPILAGHHSEARDRRTRDRIGNGFRAGVRIPPAIAARMADPCMCAASIQQPRRQLVGALSLLVCARCGRWATKNRTTGGQR